MAESVLCLGYLLLIVVIATTQTSALKTPFYNIFVVTGFPKPVDIHIKLLYSGIAALLNDIVSFILRIFNQVFYLGPEHGDFAIF